MISSVFFPVFTAYMPNYTNKHIDKTVTFNNFLKIENIVIMDTNDPITINVLFVKRVSIILF